MSNIYIQEPPTEGKVLLETTVGDIDIELWSRECPKACRNFVQLCMEGYYDKSPFHRLVKGFIVQGGDPTGSGTGGASIWGKPFKDEVHSRLRFVRRGLVAMANGGRDDNASQFFFTLGPTPELQNKHTIFGKVGGNTIYNMIKLEDGEIDEDERPRYPHKILKTKILNNPFEDIVPRRSIKSLSDDKSNRNKSTATATKNYSLLSFGIEAEEEEEEIDSLNVKFSGKGKSSHDLTSDPKLSSKSVEVDHPSSTGDPPAAGEDAKKRDKKRKADDDENESEESEDDDEDSVPESNSGAGGELTVSSVKEKLQAAKNKASSNKSKLPESSKNKKSKKGKDAESSEEEYYLGKEEKEAEKLRLESIRKEYRALKKSMKDDKEADAKAKSQVSEVEAQSAKSNQVLDTYFQEQEVYKEKKRSSGVTKKGEDREAQTLALLAKFKNKISSAKESKEVEEEEEAKIVVDEGLKTAAESDDANKVVVQDKIQIKGNLYEGEDDYDPSDTSWLAKSLHTDGEAAAVLAKDANRKADDWYEIYDPKNPLNRRRREESKRAEGEKWKKFKPTD